MKSLQIGWTVGILACVVLGLAGSGCKRKAGAQASAPKDAPKDESQRCGRLMDTMARCNPSAAKKGSKEKFVDFCKKVGWSACWNKSCTSLKSCLHQATRDHMSARKEQKYRAQRAKKKRREAPGSWVKKRLRYATIGWARVRDPFPSLAYDRKGHVKLGADLFVLQLHFKASKGAVLKVDGVERRATEKDQRFSFTVQLKDRFLKALDALDLPATRRGSYAKVPDVMLEIPASMTHPSRDLHKPSKAALKISLRDILATWFSRRRKASQPLSLPGEGTQTPSGKVLLYVAGTSLYYFSRTGGKLKDARYFLNSIAHPTRSKRCGPYRNRRRGTRNYYTLKRKDVVFGLYSRKTGKRKAKKRFWARGRCPRVVRYGRISAEYWRDADLARWVRRYLR